MGQLSTHDYILLGIRLFPLSRIDYDEREELAKSLGYSSLTVRRTLTDLKKSDFVLKTKEDDRSNFTITEKGLEEADALLSEISNYYFTPERHGVPVSIKLVEVLKLIQNPFFKAFLMKLYFEKENFDLIDTLKTFEMLEKETSLYNLFEKIDIFQNSPGMPNFVHSFMEATLFGIEDEEPHQLEGPRQKSIEVLLLEADMKIVRGRFDEGLALYNSILQKPDLPQDIWFIANVGRIKTYGRMGAREEWIRALEETRRATENKIALGFLNQIEADLLGTAGEYEQAKTLFEKSIGTFRYYNYPVFLSIAYNNYGVLMFNKDLYDEAEKLWKKARRYASEGGSKYVEASALTNLASIMRIKGELRKAKQYLEKVKKTYITLNNLESLSVIEYNVSLVYLSEKKFDQAIDLFNKSMLITFPLLSEDHKKERLVHFKKVAEKYKYTPLRRGPKYELVYIG